jgi:hypothetical protein
MSLAVDNPILNNPFSPRSPRRLAGPSESAGADEEPKEYWIYDEGQPKRMSGRRPAGYNEGGEVMHEGGKER